LLAAGKSEGEEEEEEERPGSFFNMKKSCLKNGGSENLELRILLSIFDSQFLISWSKNSNFAIFNTYLGFIKA
jgi:hypothetical protein